MFPPSPPICLLLCIYFTISSLNLRIFPLTLITLSCRVIIKSSAESNLECIKDASKNPKRLWSKIKSLLHSSPPVEQLSPSLSQPLANYLASFFCQKIVALKESISSKLHSGPSPFDFDQPHAADLLSDFAPVTPAEVTRLLQSMSNKSSQLDYIPTSLLKSCADTFCSLISHLANLFFSQATFPTNFKLALISSLLKKPGLPKSDFSNFRPISNLKTIGKILERLALARLFPHVSDCRSLPVSVLFSLLTASSIQLKLPCSNLRTTSSKT